MLPSGIPPVKEYQRLEGLADYRRLLEYSRAFRDDIQARGLSTRRYDAKWVDDPFGQWSRRWEYVYVLQRLERWWQQYPDALDIADAGSGFTFFPYCLRADNPAANIVCLDADPTAGRAVDAATSALGEGPSFALQDLEALELDDNSLDVVFSVSVIEHTGQPQRVVEEIQRVLKPGGLFVCTFDISFESASPMHVARVEELVARIHELFNTEDGASIDIAPAAAGQDRVTTEWVARHHPERLPWRNPLLIWLYDALRGRVRSGLYRPMTFFCGTFLKKRPEQKG